MEKERAFLWVVLTIDKQNWSWLISWKCSGGVPSMISGSMAAMTIGNAKEENFEENHGGNCARRMAPRLCQSCCFQGLHNSCRRARRQGQSLKALSFFAPLMVGNANYFLQQPEAGELGNYQSEDHDGITRASDFLLKSSLLLSWKAATYRRAFLASLEFLNSEPFQPVHADFKPVNILLNEKETLEETMERIDGGNLAGSEGFLFSKKLTSTDVVKRFGLPTGLHRLSNLSLPTELHALSNLSLPTGLCALSNLPYCPETSMMEKKEHQTGMLMEKKISDDRLSYSPACIREARKHLIERANSLHAIELLLFEQAKLLSCLGKDSMPKQVNMSGCSYYPPGFRFHPSDDLICKCISDSTHHLQKEHVRSTFPDTYDCETWSLPDTWWTPKREWYSASFKIKKYYTGTRVRNAMVKHKDFYSLGRPMGSLEEARLIVEYMNAGSLSSLDNTDASHGKKIKGLFKDVQAYKDAVSKISNWPLNILRRDWRKSSELPRVWPAQKKIVSWSSASYLLLLIFSLYATTTLLSLLNCQWSLLDGRQTGKPDLYKSQLLSELEGDLVRPTGSLYHQQTANRNISWTFSSFSFFLFPTTLLVAILLLELHLEASMSIESYQADTATNDTTGGSGLRGHKQKHWQLQDARITKGNDLSQSSASYALLLIALLSAVTSLLVALNFQGSISDGSYPGSWNLYRHWFFISINSTFFFTSVAMMIILMRELSLGTWLLISTLSMLGSYACLVIKVVPLHGTPLILLGIPSTMLARALRNVAPAKLCACAMCYRLG